MDQPPYRRVFCRNCGQQLTETPPRGGFTGQPHDPCPNCGGTAREYQLGFDGSIAPTGDVTIEAPAATATATAPAPSTVIKEGLEAGTFTRSVRWSKTDGDAWFAEIHDQHGDIVGVEVGFDAYDVLVVLADYLLPPEVE